MCNVHNRCVGSALFFLEDFLSPTDSSIAVFKFLNSLLANCKQKNYCLVFILQAVFCRSLSQRIKNVSTFNDPLQKTLLKRVMRKCKSRFTQELGWMRQRFQNYLHGTTLKGELPQLLLPCTLTGHSAYVATELRLMDSYIQILYNILK